MRPFYTYPEHTPVSRASSQSQRLAAWLWRRLYRKRDPPQSRAVLGADGQLSTTAMNADAVGEEEHHIAARLWT